MGILTKEEIYTRIQNGDIIFSPGVDAFQMQAHAVDLRLGFTFLIPKLWQITKHGREALNINPLETEYNSTFFEIIELEKGQYFDLLPQEYVLVSSFESVEVPNDLMAILYPRSSINRKGLSVDLTGIIDAGYAGQLTLPIKNNTRSQVIRLYPGERFCQIVFETLNETVTPRKSRYHQHDIIDGAAQENTAETDMILKGDIRALKKDHPYTHE